MTVWMKAGNNAVITGGAGGIGLAVAIRFAEAGMNVMIADLDAEVLDAAGDKISAVGSGKVHTQVCDVSDNAQVESLREAALQQLGSVHCLMNNAGAGLRTASPWADLESWKKQIDINLWGIIHGCHAFVPHMIEAGGRRAVINTGSKQGITNPPGNYAYNMSKAGVKNYTESLAHALRQEEGCEVSAHLLVPGFTYSGMIARFMPEKPAGAWACEQVADFMLESLGAGDFYVLCPDNDTPRELDEKRIQWNTDDLILNRSALSRWDDEYQGAYEAFIDR